MKLNVLTSPPTRKQQTQAHFEHLWKTNPEQFNPLRNVMERERLERTWNLIQSSIAIKGALVADLGYGSGILSKRLHDAGAHVHAVDIASTALEKDANIETYQGCLPKTILADDTYDLVLCTDVIAYLHPNEYRLLISELARLVKPTGSVICSTSLDIETESPLSRFRSLAETEFDVTSWSLSHHSTYIRIRDFLEAPRRFCKARGNDAYRLNALEKRQGLAKWWFKWNSRAPLFFFWAILQYPIKPLTHLLRNSRWVLLKLEAFSRFLWNDSGISHAIFAAKRRPLAPTPKTLPEERKHKKQVWE